MSAQGVSKQQSVNEESRKFKDTDWPEEGYENKFGFTELHVAIKSLEVRILESFRCVQDYTANEGGWPNAAGDFEESVVFSICSSNSQVQEKAKQPNEGDFTDISKSTFTAPLKCGIDEAKLNWREIMKHEFFKG